MINNIINFKKSDEIDEYVSTHYYYIKMYYIQHNNKTLNHLMVDYIIHHLKNMFVTT